MDQERMYYPSQDEIDLLQDILDFISLIMDTEAKWFCNEDMLDMYYAWLRDGNAISAKWEKDGETYVTKVWTEVNGDTIDVYLGNEKKEEALIQKFPNGHPFQYGKRGKSSRCGDSEELANAAKELDELNRKFDQGTLTRED